MYTVTVNGGKQHKADLRMDGSLFEGSLDGNTIKGDLVKVNDRQYHLLYKNRSYNIELLRNSHAEKTMTLRVNGVKMSLSMKDKYDELLHTLGMDELNARKVNDVKAPMPGMVLKILVAEGDEVKKGDALLVLEAMKMENILKSPCDGVVKRIAATKGSAVEKNQLLIQF